jgi:hypothetical protein
MLSLSFFVVTDFDTALSRSSRHTICRRLPSRGRPQGRSIFEFKFVREDELVGLAVETNGGLAEEDVAMSIRSSVLKLQGVNKTPVSKYDR